MNVSRSYRRGILIVVFTVLASAAVVLAAARSGAVPPRAAQDLGDQGEKLGAFELVERSGRQISEADFADRVCIVSFIFTRCQLSCPRITSVMKSLQARLEGSDVLLVSLSVDPEHDTPQVLAEYARRFEAEPERWWFLTGSRPLIYDLIQRRFKLSVMENPAPEADGTVAEADLDEDTRQKLKVLRRLTGGRVSDKELLARIAGEREGAPTGTSSPGKGKKRWW